jgi:hypothetical protein
LKLTAQRCCERSRVEAAAAEVVYSEETAYGRAI